MTRAIVTCMHLYTPDWGQEYYKPILDFYIKQMSKYRDEFDMDYLIDSNWGIDSLSLSGQFGVIKVNPALRYCNAYKEILPQIQEDQVLFLDNDMVIYKESVIQSAFDKLKDYDAAGILDSIGKYPQKALNGKTKFCPYFFCIRKDLLMKHRDIDWMDNMPEWESLGLLSIKLAEDNIRVYEFEEDKSNILFDGTQDGEKSKDLGYYHIRSGSVPAILLAWRDHQLETYWEYIKNQPKSEYLRQLCWFQYMVEKTQNVEIGYKIQEMLKDMDMELNNFGEYMINFKNYHGL